MFDNYQYTAGAENPEQGTQLAGSFRGADGKPWSDLGQDLAWFLDPKTLASIGYHGPMQAEMSGDGGGTGIHPQLKAFLDSKYGDGWTVAQDNPDNYGKGAIDYRLFSKNGDGYSQDSNLLGHGTKGANDFMSNGGSVLLTALGGAAAGAYGAAGSAAGEGGALASGMDLAADAGAFGGNSIGAAGAALGGGAAVPQAFGAASMSGGGSPLAANAGLDMANVYGAAPEAMGGSYFGGPVQAGGFSAPTESLLGGGGMLNGMPAIAEGGAGVGGLAALGGGGGGGLASSDLAALYGNTGYGATGGGGWGPVTDALGGASKFLGDNKNLVSLGGNLLNGFLGANAASKAADAQRQSGEASNALLKSIYDQNRADNAPLLATRNNALAGLNGLMTNPNSITNDPGYAFQRDQGQQGLDRRFNAGPAGYYSGAQLKAASRFNTDYATTKLDQSYNRLSNAAGLGQVGANNNQQSGQNYGNQAANNITGMGNANASGYVGGANAWGNALGGAINGWQTQDLIDRYLPRKGP